MEQISYYATAISFAIVTLMWLVSAGTLLLKKKPESASKSVSAPKSFVGIALQGVSFGLVWALHRTPFLSPFVSDWFLLNIVLQIAAVLLVAGSVWMATSAITELGKQWSFQARLIENHRLVTGGVYRIVRHPIYAAMLGMLIAVALVLSHWLILVVAVVVFFIGTKIRIGSEERLLRDAFPNEYRDYARRVPAFIPFVGI